MNKEEHKEYDYYYRVTYYRTPAETSVDFKNFVEYQEAIRFASTIRTGDVIEIKKYEKVKKHAS